MAAGTIIETASRLGISVSTTHVISSSILGVGAAKRFSAVRWSIAGRIVMAWVITLPACIFMGWLFSTLIYLVS
jgi:PiT family inorganic phosphate transporter